MNMVGSGTQTKIKDLEELAHLLGSFRNAGKKIVHCHGVFDLLHIGAAALVAAVEGVRGTRVVAATNLATGRALTVQARIARILPERGAALAVAPARPAAMLRSVNE